MAAEARNQDEVWHTRLVILNHMLSHSVTRAAQEHQPPLQSADELLGILQHRMRRGVAVEVFDSDTSDDPDDAKRIEGARTNNFVRLRSLDLVAVEDRRYAVLLIDAVDHGVRSMPVLDVLSYEGRDIAGDENERGAFSTHVVIGLPKAGAYDDGNYRCVIEASTGVTRRAIQSLINRQLRRYARDVPFEFEVETPRVRKPLRRTFKYQPKVKLVSDVGRSAFGGERDLSHMVFTKRSERMDITNETEVIQDDVLADVDLRISARQAPDDPQEKKGWFQRIRDYYEGLGYTTRLYFKQLGGRSIGGSVGPALDGAADLLMCPREEIVTKSEPRKWVGTVQLEVRDAMMALVDRDELWERPAARA